jgi:hypothetical protein
MQIGFSMFLFASNLIPAQTGDQVGNLGQSEIVRIFPKNILKKQILFDVKA